MDLSSQRKKKQERKSLSFCFSISISLKLLSYVWESCDPKEFPCWQKIKFIFHLPLFSFLLENSAWPELCVVMRSSIAFLYLTLMKTVTLLIFFFFFLSLLLLFLRRTFSSLISASDPSKLSFSFKFYEFCTLWFVLLIYFCK